LQIVDEQDNPVAESGVPITIAISGAAQLTGTTTRSTDSNGRATFSGITVTGPAGNYTLTFSGQGTPITAPLVITAGSASAAMSSLTLSPTTVAADVATNVTVTVRDAQGNPISGASVALSASPGPGEFGNASLTTGTNGTASTTFSTAAIGAQTIS